MPVTVHSPKSANRSRVTTTQPAGGSGATNLVPQPGSLFPAQYRTLQPVSMWNCTIVPAQPSAFHAHRT